jgi:prolyl 4-hydroxylase
MAKRFEEPLRQDPSSSTEEEEEDSELEDEEHEDETNEDGSYGDDDDEEASPSLWTELKEAWRQHAVAVVVAIAATALYYYSNGVKVPIMSSKGSIDSASLTSLVRHSHLDGYRRTANISFCFGIGGDSEGRGPATGFDLPSSDRLQRPQLVRMDFNIPKSLVPAMKLHYVADLLEDDDYRRVVENDVDDFLRDRSSEVTDPALDCIDRLFNDSPQSFIKGYGLFFKDPEFETLYRDQPGRGVLGSTSRPHPAHLTFTGFAAKFFNLSPKPVLLFWDGRTAEQRRLVGEIAPFESLGTATTPGQSFSASPVYDSSHALDRWVVTADDCLVYYEPDDVAPTLGLRQRNLYNMQKLNREFAKHYLIHAKRAWLANFPRPFPVHSMWPASHFGEVHTVRDDLAKTYQLTVESVTPRVFSIEDFLSPDECDQLIQLALQQGLQASTVYSGSFAKQQRDLHTRSSMNTWLARSTANLTDRVYRRAAAVLAMDEALLQAPVRDEENEQHLHPHSTSLAESLQVVRYKKKQEYTAHHDFVYPSQTHRMQPTRFATLLLYLNDDFTGGQTVFPRAVNAHFHDGISIEPKKGRAVLFYNVLPDGNVDDLSIHSSKPVEKGEKVRVSLHASSRGSPSRACSFFLTLRVFALLFQFLANLWIWEPVIN